MIDEIEGPFPYIPAGTTTTTDPTNVNIIVPVIPIPERVIMDFALLLIGTNLNTCLCFIVIATSSMHTSANCYIVSLMISNLAILLEPFQQVFRWLLNIDLGMNLDYIFLVTFDTSSLTIILLSIETYVAICKKNAPICKSLHKISTAVKSILFVWVMCIVTSAMELHLYDHFEMEIMDDIYVSSTIMFLVFPCLVFIMLDSFILYTLMISKSITGVWPNKDIDRFVLLVGITVVFFLTMAPYRIVRCIYLTTMTSYYSINLAIEILYTIVKIYTIILPITCFTLSKELNQILKQRLCCQMMTNPQLLTIP